MIEQDEARTLRRRILERAREFQQKGFAVKVEPQVNDLPPFLKSFEVHILAQREGEAIVVEVQTSAGLGLSSRREELARVVQDHPGWQFEVEVVDATTAAGATRSPVSSIPLTRVRLLLEAAKELQGRDAGAAYLMLWAAIEVLLERAAATFSVSVADLGVTLLTKALFTEGVLSRPEYDLLGHGWRVRNRIVHSGATPPEDQLADQSAALAQWAHDLVRQLEARGAE